MSKARTAHDTRSRSDPFAERMENTALRAARDLLTRRNLATLAGIVAGTVAAWFGVPLLGRGWIALGQAGQIALGVVLLAIAAFFALVFKRSHDARRMEDAFRDKAERERKEGSFEYIGIGQVWDTIVAPTRGPKRDVRRIQARALNLIGTPGQATDEPTVTSLHPWTIQLHTLFGQAWTSALEVLGPEEQARVQMALAKLREVRMREFGNRVVARHVLVGVGSGTTAIRNLYLNAAEFAETGDPTFVWLTHPLFAEQVEQPSAALLAPPLAAEPR